MPAVRAMIRDVLGDAPRTCARTSADAQGVRIKQRSVIANGPGAMAAGRKITVNQKPPRRRK